MGKKMLAIAILAIMWLTTSALAQQKEFTLTKEGVGAIKLGMRFDQIPAKCEGLYTHFKKVERVYCDAGEKYIDYIFYYGKLKIMKTTQDYVYDEKTVLFITCYTPLIKATNGMHAGMPSVELYNRGAKAQNITGGYFNIGDYNFVTPLSASGKKKAECALGGLETNPIAPSDFPKGATITEMLISIYGPNNIRVNVQ